MSADFLLPSGGGETVIPARIKSAHLQLNPHFKADELHLDLDAHDAGIDPRFLARAVCRFAMGNADEFGEWQPNIDQTRFVGRVSKAQRAGDDGSHTVSVDCIDYTSFFLLAKPFATAGIPELSMTLAEAWRRICEYIPGSDGQPAVAALADRIVFRGLSSPGPVIAEAVSPRFAKLKGRVAVQPKSDAWAVWMQCVGMCGLISYFELDQCIVTTALDFYTKDDPPVLAYGRSLFSYEEERNNDFKRDGIGVTCFDPITGKTIEALWPPAVAKTSKGKKPKVLAADSDTGRDYFQVQGVTNPEVLLDVAKLCYAERATQEMAGTATTHEMSVATASEEQFDMLTLRSGDTMHVLIDEVDFNGAALLGSNPSLQERQEYFESRGYPAGLAQVVAENLDELTSLRREFYVLTVDTRFDVSDGGGSFQIDVGYCNKITNVGDALAGSPTDLELEF